MSGRGRESDGVGRLRPGVSTRGERQVLDRQLDALRAAGCVRVFDDRSSGTSADRLGLKACLDHLRSDVVLVVLDLGRLGRLVGERAGRCLRGPACPLPYRRPRRGATAGAR